MSGEIVQSRSFSLPSETIFELDISIVNCRQTNYFVNPAAYLCN